MNLEPQQNEALRKEIGYRLSMLLSVEQGNLPERLLRLVRELSSIDHDVIIEGSFGAKSSEQVDRWLRAVLAQQEQYLREQLQCEPNQDARNDLGCLLAKIESFLDSELGSGVEMIGRV